MTCIAKQNINSFLPFSNSPSVGNGSLIPLLPCGAQGSSFNPYDTTLIHAFIKNNYPGSHLLEEHQVETQYQDFLLVLTLLYNIIHINDSEIGALPRRIMSLVSQKDIYPKIIPYCILCVQLLVNDYSHSQRYYSCTTIN